MRNISKSLSSPYSKGVREEGRDDHNTKDMKQDSYQKSNDENIIYDSASDSETATAVRSYNQYNNRSSSNYSRSSNSIHNNNNINRYSKLASHAHGSYVSGNLTDGEGDEVFGGVAEDDDDIHDNESVDEFNLSALKQPFHSSLNSSQSLNKVVKTGRQRKKEAARSKGGEFQAKRKKKRIYFCCVSSEIDVEKLYDYFITSGGLTKDKEWSLKMYSDVLHLHKPGSNNPANEMFSPRNSARLPADSVANTTIPTAATEGGVRASTFNPFSPANVSSALPTATTGLTAVTVAKANEEDTHTRISTYGSQEVFIFDFGAIVFWGFSRGDEEPFLKSIRMFVTKGYVQPHEFTSGEDDMAFVCTSNDGGNNNNDDAPGGMIGGADKLGLGVRMMLGSIDEGGGGGGEGKTAMIGGGGGGGDSNIPPLLHPGSDILYQPLITIANDVLTIPEDTPAKQRLSLSFAIAQSAVLSIFESRIDRKIVEYKYIPETMAKHGRIHLNERQLGTMIGEVFVIRHDVNLHTEILDTPDFFWKDGEKYEKDYKLIMRYLEMGARTEVLNKRLDMMRELLDVLQQQMENDHGVKLEWIVIWLIVVEVVLQMIAIAVDSLAWKSTHSVV